MAVAIGVAFMAASLLLTSASANEVPPPVQFAATHEHPVAGRTFTGIMVTSVGAHVQGVACDARIGLKRLHVEKNKFYAGGAGGPVAVVCGVKIPRGAHGTLTMRSSAFTPPDATAHSAPIRWQIKP